MEVEVRGVAPGRPAVDALRAWVGAAQGADRLRPVTVVAPSRVAGLGLRRALAAGSAGVVAARVTVLEDLAALLSAADRAAAARPPLTPALRRHVARLALARRPGALAGVAGHPATERVVDLALAELRRATAAGGEAEVLDGLRAHSPLTATLAGLHAEARALSAGHEDDQDVLLAAATAAARPGALRDVGPVAVFLPPEPTPAGLRLLRAVAASVPVTLLLPRTGDPAADTPPPLLAALAASPATGAPALRAQALGAPGSAAPAPGGPGSWAPGPGGGVRPGAGVRVVAAPDQDEEVRVVRREVAALLARGVPAPRIAVLYRDAAPYATLLREAFTAAGLPVDGPPVRTLAQTPAGRALVGLLELDHDGWTRQGVADWLAAAPVRDARGPVPATRWDRVARRAGVVVGRDQWRRRLSDVAPDADPDAAAALLAFLDGLWQRLDDRPAPGWGGAAAWLTGLLDAAAGPPAAHVGWAPGDRDAEVALRDRVAALAALDGIGAPAAAPDATTVLRVLRAELDGAADRAGSPGGGVRVGPIDDAPFLDADHVLVVGMAEGSFPDRPPEQPLLPDALRQRLRDHHPGLAAAAALSTRSDHVRRSRAALWGALRPATTLLHPQADRRRGRERVPAPWLLELAGAAAGEDRPLRTDDLRRLAGAPWYRVVASAQAGLRTGGEPATAAEWTTRRLLALPADRDPADHPLMTGDPVLAAAVTVERARRSPDFTAWDGLVGPHPFLEEQLTGVLSPTRLAGYATCPRRFLLSRVLGVDAPEEPDEGPEVGPLRRGTILHETLERFLDGAGAEALPDADERRRLLDVAADRFDAAQAAGGVGQPVLWRIEQDRLRTALERWLDEHRALRRDPGVRPYGAELAFGDDGDALGGLEVGLPGGRSVRMGGRIDRLDTDEHQGVVLVLDYKTGDDKPYQKVADDPVLRGTQLQLAVYALLARARWPGARVLARYWFLGSRTGAGGWRGFELDAEAERAARAALDVIVEGIAGGVFPPRPGDYDDFRGEFTNCRTCPFPRVCPAAGERERSWHRARRAPQVARYRDLAEGPRDGGREGP